MSFSSLKVCETVILVVMYFDYFFLMLSFLLFLQASLSLYFGSLVDSGGPAQCPNSGLRIGAWVNGGLGYSSSLPGHY